MKLPSNSGHYKTGLAPQQFRLLLAIMDMSRDRTPLTYRRLMVRMKWRSPAHIMQVLDKLERLGFARREKGRNATLQPTCTLEMLS